jgi:hypothetical protein
MRQQSQMAQTFIIYPARMLKQIVFTGKAAYSKLYNYIEPYNMKALRQTR